MTDLLPGEIHVTMTRKLAAAEELIRDLLTHEGAEGFSDSTHVAIDEFNRMVVDSRVCTCGYFAWKKESHQ